MREEKGLAGSVPAQPEPNITTRSRLPFLSSRIFVDMVLCVIRGEMRGVEVGKGERTNACNGLLLLLRRLALDRQNNDIRNPDAARKTVRTIMIAKEIHHR